MDDELEEIAVPVTAEARVYATWNYPAPHWAEITGASARPVYRGRCFKKVYRSFAHAAADARSMRYRNGHRDATVAYWCRRCRGFHVGRPGASQYERIRQIRPDSDLRAA